MTKPTDDELMAVIREVSQGSAMRREGGLSLRIARAVLAKWGQPSGAGEVDRADAVNLARNCLGAYNCAITKKGIRVLAEAVLSMDAALSTPQPTQAQAGAVPLTSAQIEAAAPEYSVDDFLDFNAGVRFAEQHHGIKGGQHGAE